MKNLLEISRILTKKKVNKIELFDQHSLKHKNSKFNEFYEALQAGRFKNDRDAAAYLYQCSPTDDKYRQLKSRFRKRLLNTMFFLDVNQPSTSDYERASFSSQKEWTLINLLMSYGATATAALQARQLLTTALKFQFSEMVVLSARLLRSLAAQQGDEKEFEQYDAYVKAFAPVREAEIQSEEWLERVLLWYGGPVAGAQTHLPEIDRYCLELRRLREKTPSHQVAYNSYLAAIHRHEFQKDFLSMLEALAQAEAYMEKHPSFFSPSQIAQLILKKMSAYLHIGDFRQGKKLAEQRLSRLPDGGPTWFQFMEYYALLAIQTENILPALAIYHQCTEHKEFKKLPPEVREKWSIIQNYLQYFIESQASENPILLSQRKKVFHVNRFLNDPLLYSKDQRIFTVLQVIVQLLFLLEKRNFAQAVERIDRLKSYTARQLKKPQYERLLQFVKLLQQLTRAKFRPAALLQTEKPYQALVDEPFLYRGQIDELEILRYEQLWELILARLETRH